MLSTPKNVLHKLHMEIILFHVFSNTFKLTHTKHCCICTCLYHSLRLMHNNYAHKACLGGSGFEQKTEDNIKWGLYCIWEAFILSKNKRKTKTVIPTICEHAPNLYYYDIRWHKHTGFEPKKKKIVFPVTHLHVIFSKINKWRDKHMFLSTYTHYPTTQLWNAQFFKTFTKLLWEF